MRRASSGSDADGCRSGEGSYDCPGIALPRLGRRRVVRCTSLGEPAVLHRPFEARIAALLAVFDNTASDNKVSQELGSLQQACTYHLIFRRLSEIGHHTEGKNEERQKQVSYDVV